MTVKELIQLLQQTPNDAVVQIEYEREVWYSELSCGEETEWTDVKQVNNLENKVILVS